MDACFLVTGLLIACLVVWVKFSRRRYFSGSVSELLVDLSAGGYAGWAFLQLLMGLR